MYGKGAGQVHDTGAGAVTNSGAIAVVTAPTTSWRSGWVVGGGLEQGFLHNWSVKADYDYIGLGTTTVGSLVTLGGGGIAVGSAFSVITTRTSRFSKLA